MKRRVAGALIAVARACSWLGSRSMASARAWGGWSDEEMLRRFCRADRPDPAPMRTKPARDTPGEGESSEGRIVEAPDLGPEQGLYYQSPADGRVHPIGQGPWN